MASAAASTAPRAGFYERLARAAPGEGLTALRVRFRDPRDLDEAVADVLLGVALLAEEGVGRVALVGHSFGGAVVIRAAVGEPRVATVVTLAAQSHGAESVAALAPRPLLLVHGGRDRVLPPSCSQSIHRLAAEPKRLVLLPGAGHAFDEHADDVGDLLRGWLHEHLPA